MSGIQQIQGIVEEILAKAQFTQGLSSATGLRDTGLKWTCVCYLEIARKSYVKISPIFENGRAVHNWQGK